MLPDQAGINMANYCRGVGGRGGEEVGEGPDGSGHPSDSRGGGRGSERLVMGGDALHCEGHVEGQRYSMDSRAAVKARSREGLRSHPAHLVHSRSPGRGGHTHTTSLL